MSIFDHANFYTGFWRSDYLDMSSLVSITLTLATLLLYIPQTEVSHPLNTSNSKVMLFHDMWVRSQCRSLEMMVEVEQEYPGNVEHIFRPGCVPLQRCSGCCNDEKLECLPTLTHNVTMQLLRINPTEKSRQYVQLSFLEHYTCECRLKRIHAIHRSRQRLRIFHRRRKRKNLRKRAANWGR